MKRLPRPSLAALAAAALLAGCIHHHSTVRNEEPRLKVDFESDTAGRVFYEALSRSKGPSHRQETRTEFSIPIVFEYEERVIDGDNVRFNRAVRRCDTNQDGRITEQEARIFAASP
ncbi:MAG: hypothetical protein ACKOET_03115 [Verrucomicrobiota bacterium]